MSTAVPNDSKTKVTEDPAIIGHVTIRSNEMERVRLGRYLMTDPNPQFHVHYYPHDAPHVVSYHDSPVEHEDNTYTLYRHFQNFGDTACTVTVKRDGQGSKLK